MQRIKWKDLDLVKYFRNFDLIITSNRENFKDGKKTLGDRFIGEAAYLAHF